MVRLFAIVVTLAIAWLVCSALWALWGTVTSGLSRVMG